MARHVELQLLRVCWAHPGAWAVSSLVAPSTSTVHRFTPHAGVAHGPDWAQQQMWAQKHGLQLLQER